MCGRSEVVVDARGRVARALAATPRAGFLPVAQRRFAEQDQPLPLGHGQTNSQPTIVRRMLELLEVEPGHRVLDVGSGSAWTTALLAHLVGEQGRVYGVERVPALVELGRSHLAGFPTLQSIASVDTARPGVLGLPEHAPYDRVLVSAAAPEMPDALVRQLGPDGVLVAPVAGRLVRVRRGEAGDEVEVFGSCRFVPLVTDS